MSTKLEKGFIDYLKDIGSIITEGYNPDHCHCIGSNGHKVRYYGGKPDLRDQRYWTKDEYIADMSYMI